MKKMSVFNLKILPFVRYIGPRINKCFFHRSGFQRNYWRRRDSFSELSTTMQTFENTIKEMDKEISRIFGEIQRASPVKLSRVASPFDWGRIRDIPVVSADGGRSYKIELEMHDMKPENINITLKNNVLTIIARQDEKRDDGSRFVRENTYHYTLPNEINPDTIRSSLSYGILTIEAPLPALESKEIPVNIEREPKSDDSDSDSKKTNK